LLNMISTGIDVFMKMGELVKAPFKRRRMQENLLRLLYLELQANLDLFTVVGGVDGLAKLALKDASTTWLIQHLSTASLELILLGDLESFNATNLIGVPRNERDENDGGSYLPETPLHILRYLALKIAFLKSVSDDPKVLEDSRINVGIRLGRIHEFMLTIVKGLEGRPEIQRMRQRS